MAGLLRGRYEPLGIVRRTPEGELIKAHDHLHQRVVALRVRPAPTRDIRDAVLAEGRALLTVRAHPGLPTVRDDFFSEDSYVVVMDWVDGEDLEQALRAGGARGIPVSTALDYLRQAADALDHLHRHDPPVVHGCVSLADLVVGPGGRVVLVGLGARPAEPRRPVDDLHALARAAATLLAGRSSAADPEAHVVPDRTWCKRVLERALDPDRAGPITAGGLVEQLTAAYEAHLPTGVVTLLLTDVERSTELWEHHREAAVGVLPRQRALIAEAVEAHGGWFRRNQEEGDSTLSAFPSASNALAAALAAQHALTAEAWPDGITLRVRMALHTGEVLVEDGDYGGAAVSRAARIRTLATGGQVLVSQATAQLVVDAPPAGVELIDTGAHTLKGLSRPERVYLVRAPGLVDSQPAREPTGRVAPPDSPGPLPLPVALPTGRVFVGRDPEVAMLLGAWSNAVQGSARVVMLAGDPGVGKTSLCAQFAREVHASGASVVYGRCHQENLLSHQPFAEAVQSYASAVGDEALRAEVVRAGTMLTRLVPDLAERLPNLPAPPGAQPDTDRYLLYEALTRLLRVVAERAPLLVVLDDLQWADRPTLAMLGHALRGLGKAPVLVVGTYREFEVEADHPLTDLVADLRRDRLLDSHHLGGLADTDVATLVRAHAGGDVADGLVAAVVRQTEGNPFFVEELVRHLAETGATTTATWTEQLGLPEGVKDVTRRRLARLSPPAREILGPAAVIGREFDQPLLEALVDPAGGDLLDALDECVAARVLDELPTTGSYAFSHALIQETLQAQLTASRRARFHRRIGEALESGHHGPLDDNAPALAHHFREAGDEPSKAAAWAHRAGERALDRLAYEEAASWFEHALDTVGDDADPEVRCDLLLDLGEARQRIGDNDRALEIFQRAAEYARGLGDAERLAEAAARNFQLHFFTATSTLNEPLVALLEEALGALGLGDSLIRARVMAHLGACLHFTSQRDRRVQLTGDAVAMARRLGDPATLAETFVSRFSALHDPAFLAERSEVATELSELAHDLGNTELSFLANRYRVLVLLEAGNVHGVDEALASCTQLSDELHQPLLRFFATMVRATFATLAGDLDGGERLAAETLKHGLEAGHPGAFMVFGAQLGMVRADQGRLAEVVASIEQMVEQYPMMPAWRAVLALVYCELDQLERAEEQLDRLSAVGFANLPMDMVWATAIGVSGEVCAALDDRARARALYDLLLPFEHQVMVSGPATVCTGSLARPLGLLARTLGDLDTAARHFEDALKVNTRIGARTFLTRTQHDYAQMLLTRQHPGDSARARALLNDAAATATEIGMARLASQIGELLDQARQPL